MLHNSVYLGRQLCEHAKAHDAPIDLLPQNFAVIFVTKANNKFHPQYLEYFHFFEVTALRLHDFHLIEQQPDPNVVVFEYQKVAEKT